ncbi:bifunctional acetate--CoA ligase family protein/GNAT family N-acetyltransferase [Phaeacidiphilus oryzae]|uniref:bifunctional acetate--CoA ligase family protein/GNAT family N-acetyltransferase n=1 Tax=Phaeacidiphilus oryzae TaxID=348818 RepID=UPI000A059435|nr:GNAT family N-acetyltransferase [Phaeacidiphilus oryzae]
MSSAPPVPEAPRPVEALLADGSTALIRPLASGDREAVRELHSVHMSEESRRLRFFGASRRAPEEAARRLCAPPRPGFLALGAWVGEELVGVVEYSVYDGQAAPLRPGETPGTAAELAVAVAEEWHHRGVGTLLIEHLLHAARERGLRVIEAEALADNHAVHKVFADLGLHVHRRWEHGQVRISVDLEEQQDEDYRRAVDERGRTADVASLMPLLRPRSVAVVGASRRPGSVGQSVLRRIRDGGFAGALYAVNPYAERIADTDTYPSVGTLPVVCDLALLAVPPVVVPSAAEECGRAGTRALVVLTAGLEDAQARRLLQICRRYSMRLVGPNCLGIAQTDPEVRLAANFAGTYPAAGEAGIAVQSGGVGIALLQLLSRLGVGVSSFVSLGDKYDVSGNDLLQWWESDGRTKLALLHLESFGNPRAFSRTARRVSRRMPVLTVDAGRSNAGRRAAASHSAAAATATVTRRALFTQAGITATDSIAELVETAALFASQPLPAGSGRVAVVSNAGGVAVLAADACAEAGLTVPELPPDLVGELLAVLPEGAHAANPVDITAEADAAELDAALAVLNRSPLIDSVLVCLAPTALGGAPGRALRSGPARRRHPVAAVVLGQSESVELLPTDDGGHVPVYADPQQAARALAHAAARARHLAEPEGVEPELPDVQPGRAAAEASAFLAAHPEGGLLDPAATASLLGCYGIPTGPSVWLRADELGEAEDGAVLGGALADAVARLTPLAHRGRLVAKAYWPGQVHKSEFGAVRTDLEGIAQVRAAVRDFRTRFAGRLDGVVLQPTAAPGIELFAGVAQDRVFGPLVLFGLGGTAADLLDDRAARLAPLTDTDVDAMLTGVHATPLLFGYRGTPKPDLAALEHLLARLSRLATDLPQLAEADLNPVIAGPDGAVCVDARLRLLPVRPFDPYLRRLRELPEPPEEPTHYGAPDGAGQE